MFQNVFGRGKKKKEDKKPKKVKDNNNNNLATSTDAVEPTIEDGRAFKLVVMGEGGVGKTAITIQFMSNKFVAEYDPTIEDAYKKEYTMNDKGVDKNIVVEIVDTAGQEEFSAGLHDKFIRQGEGFLLVYSITSASSFEKIKEIREKIIWTKDQVNVPMIIVGNKKDLEKERKVAVETAEAVANQYNCPFLEASAKTAENVTESIELLLLEIAKAGVTSDSGVMKRPAKKG